MSFLSGSSSGSGSGSESGSGNGVMFSSGSGSDSGSGPHQISGAMPLIAYALFFIGLWFILIAPQRKKQKLRDEMINALKKNDRILTTSGISAKILEIKGNILVIEIANGVNVELHKSFVHIKLD
jgi:preprotein translocase subunit YajC